jgi:hypothetical protein
MHRRDTLKLLLAATVLSWRSARAAEIEPYDFKKARAGYLDRIVSIEKNGMLPILDIESSYNPTEIDLPAFVRSMDRVGIAQMCISVDQPSRLVREGKTWSHDSLESARKYPVHLIPAGNGGSHPAWTLSPDRFLDDNERYITEHHYPLMGEFEFRHYPSPRQVQRGDLFRDVTIPIDGPQGHRLFLLAERTGIPFQIHYEIEDSFLDSLESMLARYPNAKVIWCHFAQIRYQARSSRYSPRFLQVWLEKYPGLYIDTAFGHSLSVYPLSGERHARYWSKAKDWQSVIVAHPYRFLAALDIGGDRMNRVEEWTLNLRAFLNTLPSRAQEIVAYKAAWKLLFSEEL